MVKNENIKIHKSSFISLIYTRVYITIQLAFSYNQNYNFTPLLNQITNKKTLRYNLLCYCIDKL